MKCSLLRLLAGLALGGAMTSTAAAPKPERVLAGSVRVVGVVNEVDPSVTHTHIGKTIFGTFKHDLDNDWDIPGFIDRGLTEQLAAHGIVAKKVELTSDERKYFIGQRCNTWTGRFRPTCAAPIQAMLQQRNVDALMIIRTYGAQEGGFSEKGYVEGYGLFTVGFKDPKDATVHAYIGMPVYAGNPVRRLDTAFCPKTEIIHHTFSKPVEQATLADLAWIRPRLEALLQDGIGNSLKASGLIPGEPTPCIH